MRRRVAANQPPNDRYPGEASSIFECAADLQLRACVSPSPAKMNSRSDLISARQKYARPRIGDDQIEVAAVAVFDRLRGSDLASGEFASRFVALCPQIGPQM